MENLPLKWTRMARRLLAEGQLASGSIIEARMPSHHINEEAAPLQRVGLHGVLIPRPQSR